VFSILKTLVFTAASVPAEAITISSLNYTPLFFGLYCLVNRKVKFFKETVFLSEQFAVSKSYNKCSKCCLSASTRADNCLLPCQ